MTHEDVKATSDMVAGMLQMNDYQIHILFDFGATHSFIANKNVTKLSKETKKAEKGFIIGTPLGETVSSVQTVTVQCLDSNSWTIIIQS
jgi:hypothetical protein